MGQTRVAHNILTENGIAIIQIRYDDGSVYFRPKVRNYFRYAISFTSYYIDEFWQITIDAGFSPIAIVLNPSVRYAYYFLKKDPNYGSHN